MSNIGLLFCNLVQTSDPNKRQKKGSPGDAVGGTNITTGQTSMKGMHGSKLQVNSGMWGGTDTTQTSRNHFYSDPLDNHMTMFVAFSLKIKTETLVLVF